MTTHADATTYSVLDIPRRARRLTLTETIHDFLFNPLPARRVAPDPWINAWQAALRPEPLTLNNLTGDHS